MLIGDAKEANIIFEGSYAWDYIFVLAGLCWACLIICCGILYKLYF